MTIVKQILQCLAIANILWAIPASSAETAFDNPVDDATLANSYGKYLAPNGIDLAMSVQSDTAVNGHLVLRSVFTIDQGPGTLRVYAPANGSSGPVVTAPSGTGTAQSSPGGGVSASVDRSTGTTVVSPTGGSSSSGVSVSVGASPSQASAGNDGLTAVQASSTGVQTGAGVVSVTSGANGARITLDGAGLSISHLVGAATGAIIANSANDRTINTITNVQIDVRNASSLAAGSAMVRIDSLATAATRAMMR